MYTHTHAQKARRDGARVESNVESRALNGDGGNGSIQSAGPSKVQQGAPKPGGACEGQGSGKSTDRDTSADESAIEHAGATEAGEKRRMDGGAKGEGAQDEGKEQGAEGRGSERDAAAADATTDAAVNAPDDSTVDLTGDRPAEVTAAASPVPAAASTFAVKIEPGVTIEPVAAALKPIVQPVQGSTSKRAKRQQAAAAAQCSRSGK
jgi:hypothetical protein